MARAVNWMRWAAVVLAVVSILLMFVGMWAESEPSAPPAPPTFSAPQRMVPR